MQLSDGGRVCLTCRFFEGQNSECQRFPPSIKSTYTDDNGDRVAYWNQPHIDLEWATTCGEWQAASGCDSEEERVLRVRGALDEYSKRHPDIH